MQVQAALLREQPGRWVVEQVELDPPGHNEVLVEVVASGLCHSDDHMATGDVPAPVLPLCGGHEAAGVVREVGPGVQDFAAGDHIVTSFIPSCGRCRWCTTGLQNLCDLGSRLLTGAQLDGSFRMRSSGGEDVATPGLLGAFAEFQIFDTASCIKIPGDVPLDVAALIGCGVPTGWGSAAHAAGLQPGDVVMILGVGGVGMNAVQGARNVGARRIVVVDPAPFKRESAPKFGATDTFSNVEEATELVRSITNGQGADATIVTVGVISGKHVTDAFEATRKAGTVVVTSQGPVTKQAMDLNLFELSMYQKRIQGVLYGTGSPRREVLRMLDMYRGGQLLLDELITARYGLGDINAGYADMHAGKNIRGIIDSSLNK